MSFLYGSWGRAIFQMRFVQSSKQASAGFLIFEPHSLRSLSVLAQPGNNEKATVKRLRIFHGSWGRAIFQMRFVHSSKQASAGFLIFEPHSLRSLSVLAQPGNNEKATVKRLRIFHGSWGRARTGNPLINSQMLYH